MEKRVSCRAIIIDRDKLVAMYREKNNKVYYTFPGGGINEGESETECVKRECLEEFGIIVVPVRKLFILEDAKTIQHYYLCNWTDGALGMGDGEEFSIGYDNGIYMPSLIPMSNVAKLPLVPSEIKDEVLAHYHNLFDDIDEVKKIESSYNG
ncbi:MAG: NUDIX domain-containing protein [Clostridia bacterium]|nr:NUDIX domain-containing protein [Clostridia bacterium]